MAPICYAAGCGRKTDDHCIQCLKPTCSEHAESGPGIDYYCHDCLEKYPGLRMQAGQAGMTGISSSPSDCSAPPDP